MTNFSVLNNVKPDWKSTISNICRVKHSIYYHWTFWNFSRQFSGSFTSFGLRSVCSDVVVVLQGKVTNSLKKVSEISPSSLDIFGNRPGLKI